MKPTIKIQMQRLTSQQTAVRATAAALVTALMAACGGGGASTGPSGQATGTDAVVTAATAASVSTLTGTTTTTTSTGTTTAAAGIVQNADKPGMVSVGVVRIQNTGAAQTSIPFTFGHPFGIGSLKAGEGLAAVLADGSAIPLQVEVKAKHADGSTRHAIISGVLPSLAAGQTAKMQLVKAVASAAGTVTPRDLVAAGLTAKVNLNVGGVAYTASLEKALAAGKTMPWLSGAIADEWFVSAPLVDANGKEHPMLQVRFGVRWYPGLKNQARVEFIVENDKTWSSASNFSYDASLQIGANTVYSQRGLTHYAHSRWHQYAWWDMAHAPAINVQLTPAALIQSRAVPNFDQSVVPNEDAIVNLANLINSSNTGPMQVGPVTAYMPTTGGRIDIGPLPSWDVTWLLTQDKRARDVMMAAADGSGTWGVHMRDEKTDYPVRTDNPTNSTITIHDNLKTTGPLPVPRCVGDNYDNCKTPFAPDTAHEPSLSYVPYMITGDYYYLEELQFWASWNPLGTDPWNNGMGKGLVRWMQLRGQAWSLRALGQVSYITPDSHPLKAYFNTQLDNNLDFYTQAYVVGNPNNLGVYDGSGEGSFAADASAPWQDDYFTWSFGFLNELGYTKALPILKWKAKYTVGRMSDQGYCWIMGPAYHLKIYGADGKIFKNFADFYKGNWSGPTLTFDDVASASTMLTGKPFVDMACDSLEMQNFLAKASGYDWTPHTTIGYAGSPLGYPANMQPALAVAATTGIPYAAQAWTTFQSRSWKPDYRKVPQWAILPR